MDDYEFEYAPDPVLYNHHATEWKVKVNDRWRRLYRDEMGMYYTNHIRRGKSPVYVRETFSGPIPVAA